MNIPMAKHLGQTCQVCGRVFSSLVSLIEADAVFFGNTEAEGIACKACFDGVHIKCVKEEAP